jgi:DNA replication and repair protein RecF
VFIKTVQVSNFRNLQKQSIEFVDGINLFVGQNGQGKTNLLEAVYFLASLRSFRSSTIKDIISYDQNQALVEGSIFHNQVLLPMKIVLDSSGRRLWLGQRSIHNAKEYLGRLKVVAFTPDDLSMIKGGPSFRRKFLDRAVFHFVEDHLQRLKDFNSALKARNQLLKTAPNDRDMIDSFSETLAKHGALLSKSRKEILDFLCKRASEILSILEQKQERLKINYKPGWKTKNIEDPGELLNQLNKNIENDIRRQLTSVGPQLDEFDVLLDGKLARKFASQGQQRSIALALLLAIVDELATKENEKPVILLDDVSSELDDFRRQHLIEQIKKIGCQVLITTANENLISEIEGNNFKLFKVVDGIIN